MEISNLPRQGTGPCLRQTRSKLGSNNQIAVWLWVSLDSTDTVVRRKSTSEFPRISGDFLGLPIPRLSSNRELCRNLPFVERAWPVKHGGALEKKACCPVVVRDRRWRYL